MSRLAVVAVLALGLACSSQRGGSAGSAGPVVTTSPAPSGSIVPGTGQVALWLAGFRVEADPGQLDADTQELIDLVGTAIDVSPVACFDGIPAKYAKQGDAYVLAIVADSRGRLEQLIRSTGRDPLFVAKVRTMCID